MEHILDEGADSVALIQGQILSLFSTKRKWLTREEIQAILSDEMAGAIEVALLALIDSDQLVVVENSYGGVSYILRSKLQRWYKPKVCVQLFSPRYFDRLSAYFVEYFKSNERFVPDVSLENEVQLPLSVISLLLKCYVKVRVLEELNGGYIRGSVSLYSREELLRVILAKEHISLALAWAKRNPITSLSQAIEDQRAYQKGARVRKLKIAQSKTGYAHIAFLSELSLGHKLSDLTYLRDYLRHLAELPLLEQPQLVVVSGLMQGNFHFTQKNRRRTLLPSFATESQQFALAKLVLDEIRFALPNARVIVTSDDDMRRICEDRTMGVLLQLEREVKIGEKGSARERTITVSWAEQNRLRQSDLYDYHLWFQYHVVWEYQLRVGRSLYDSAEMRERFGVLVDEYSVLLEAYRALSRRELVAPETRRMVSIDHIPVTGNRFDDFEVVDDVNLTVGENKIWLRHYFTLTATTYPTDALMTAERVVQNYAAAGNETPDLFVVNHYHQALAAAKGDTMFLSCPGLLDASGVIDESAFYGKVQSDPAHRIVKSRRDPVLASGMQVKAYKDGSLSFIIPSAHFLEKSTISSERVAVAFPSDFQTGSTTARPDLQVQFLDYLFYEVAKEFPLYLIFGGDLIQGTNYAAFGRESAHMGLIDIDRQKAFVRKWLRNILINVPTELIRNLRLVGAIPGNHEWNSPHRAGFSSTGALFTAWLTDMFQDYKDFSGKPVYDVLRYGDNVAYRRIADHFKFWMLGCEIAGHNIAFQHLILEKPEKGGGGKPVQQYKGLLEGLGTVEAYTDIRMAGHWHHFQFGVFGKLLGIITGSLAGLSGYEYLRGYHPVIGAVVLYLGGGLPPEIRLFPLSMLSNYKPQGFYSAPQLADSGFVTDADWNPILHGFPDAYGGIAPLSGVQKALLREVQQIAQGQYTILP